MHIYIYIRIIVFGEKHGLALEGSVNGGRGIKYSSSVKKHSGNAAEAKEKLIFLVNEKRRIPV